MATSVLVSSVSGSDGIIYLAIKISICRRSFRAEDYDLRLAKTFMSIALVFRHSQWSMVLLCGDTQLTPFASCVGKRFV